MDIVDSLEQARRRFAQAVLDDDDEQELQRRGRRMNGSAGHLPIRRHYSPSVYYEAPTRPRPQPQRTRVPAPRTPPGMRLPAGPLPPSRAPSRSRAPTPRQPLVRVPSSRRPHSSQDAVYFREGSGYLFVKTLGEGVDGSAILVRSVADGKLYVRKEEFNYEETPRANHNFSRTPPEETTNALQVQHIDGTYRPRGWTRWLNSPAGVGFSVTYWRHYDLGSLRGFASDCRHTGRPIPERWGAIWFVSMCDTMIQVQRAGLVHNDPHSGNWLVERTDGGIPRVVLGDFGRSQTRAEVSSYAFKNHCVSDFEYITSSICEALNIQYDRQGHEAWGQDQWSNAGHTVSSALVAQFNKLAKISQRHWNSLNQLHLAVSDVSAAAFEIAQNRPDGSHPAARPTPTAVPYKTGEGLLEAMVRKPQAFKQWRHARVTGSRISTQSTGQCHRLTSQAGQWYGTVPANPVWRVD